MTSPDQPEIAPQSNRAALFIVFFVVFIDLLGFGIVLPLLPKIADVYGERLISEGPNKQVMIGTLIGLLMASFSFMQFLFAPIWGQMSDRHGRRPILLLGLAASVVFYSLMGFAASLPQDMAFLSLVLFFVARIGAGIAGATIGTAQAVIADSTPPEKRKHGMALIGAAFGIGFTFGPLLGFAALQLFPERLEMVGFAAAALSAIALLLGWRKLPETRKIQGEFRRDRASVRLGALVGALKNPALAPVILVFFFASLGFASFESTLSLLLSDTFGYQNDNMFLIFAYVGFVLLLTQGYFYRKLAKKLNEVTLIAIGIVFMALGVGILGAVSYWTFAEMGTENPARMPFLFAGLTAAVVGFAFLTPSAQALISRRAEAHVQGEALGVNQSASALARILGPIIGLLLYKVTPSHMLPYAFGSVTLLLMLLVLPRIRREPV